MNGLLKKLWFVWVFCCCHLAEAQQQKVMLSCEQTKAYRLLKGDTVVIPCDTAYLLNGSIYILFKQAYERVKTNANMSKDLIQVYESMLDKQTRQMQQQDIAYEILRLKFDSLVVRSMLHIERSNQSLKAMQDSIAEAGLNIHAARADIQAASEKIKAEQRKNFKQKVMWGLGGMAVGAVVTTVVYVVLKK